MQELLIAEAAILPLYFDRHMRLLQPEVTGFYANALNQFHLKTVQLKDDH